LGDGTTLSLDIPTPLSGPSDVAAVAAGGEDGLALLSDGSVMSFGENEFGQLGDGTELGPEICEGPGLPCSKTPVKVNGLTGVTAIAQGGNVTHASSVAHSLALLEDGTVMIWGANNSGDLGDGTTQNSDVPTPVSGLSEVTAVAAGEDDSLALLKNGTVLAWGAGGRGELGDGTTESSDVPVPVSGLNEVTAIAAGNGISLALLEDGTVMAWGGGGLGNGSNEGSDVPVAVTGLTEVSAIAAGGAHALALLKNGEVMAWGENRFGGLGDGTTTKSDVPVLVSGITTATAVSAGIEYSFARLADGSVEAWGDNYEGQLGVGTFSGPEICALGGPYNIPCSRVPVSVCGLSEVAGIATGGESNVAYGPPPSTSVPTVTGVSPDGGLPSGGTKVTITGTNFTSGCILVSFGYSNGGHVSAFTVNSPTSITTVSPPARNGPVNVTVATTGGISEATPADTFTYAQPPTVKKINPKKGPAGGGTLVKITGTNLTGATAIDFGSTPAPHFTVNSATQITATSPPGAGIENITVVTPGFTSAITTKDQFKFRVAKKAK
jgi:hypothetical protein